MTSKSRHTKMDFQTFGAMVSTLGVITALGLGLYNTFRGRSQDQIANERRLTTLEMKIGLFWRLVEENLGGIIARANPIQLSDLEQNAADHYKEHRSASSTPVLRRLNDAIGREVQTDHMTAEEKAIFTLLQTAIRSQLLDRGESSDE